MQQAKYAQSLHFCSNEEMAMQSTVMSLIGDKNEFINHLDYRFLSEAVLFVENDQVIS